MGTIYVDKRVYAATRNIILVTIPARVTADTNQIWKHERNQIHYACTLHNLPGEMKVGMNFMVQKIHYVVLQDDGLT